MTDEQALLAEALLKAAFETRWRRICERSRKAYIAEPDKEALWHKLLEKYHNDFRCAYCGKGLMIKDSVRPYPRSFSIEHKVSIWNGGNNSIDNIEIICNECNTIKGTMSYGTFTEFLRICPPALRTKMCAEMWPGRLADRLDREDAIT